MLPAIHASPQIAEKIAIVKTQFDEVSAPPSTTGPNSYPTADENQHDFEQVEKLMRFITSTAEYRLSFFRNALGKRPASSVHVRGSSGQDTSSGRAPSPSSSAVTDSTESSSSAAKWARLEGGAGSDLQDKLLHAAGIPTVLTQSWSVDKKVFHPYLAQGHTGLGLGPTSSTCSSKGMECHRSAYVTGVGYGMGLRPPYNLLLLFTESRRLPVHPRHARPVQIHDTAARLP
jgi:hypothetical protein